MSGNQHQDPSAGTLIIFALVLLNAIVLKDGYTSGSMSYSWLFITVPLLIITLFYGRLKRPACTPKSLKANKRIKVGGIRKASSRRVLKNEVTS